jgi:hypothetical protein
MAALAKSKASLRVFGDNLSPQEVTESLGCPPTEAWLKGDVRQFESGRTVVRKTGAWLLEATESEPAAFDAQVSEILHKTTPDLMVWATLNKKYEIDLFCGWFMNESNEGVSVTPETLRKLGERGIELSLDIYGAGDEPT